MHSSLSYAKNDIPQQSLKNNKHIKLVINDEFFIICFVRHILLDEITTKQKDDLVVNMV